MFGRQWPTLLAGGVSTIAGVSFALAAGGDDPRFGAVTLYAAAGGAFFVTQARLLARRLRRTGLPG
jgi:hypothetical protein